MESLKELCEIAVIKQGISTTELPQTVATEVEVIESRLKLFFTGTFCYRKDFAESTLKIGWKNGEWQFALLNSELNTFRIRAGVENILGSQGGDLFLFPSRRITIQDYRIDWDGRKVTFCGKCSSVKSSSGRQFRSTLAFRVLGSNMSMSMRSQVYIEETGLYKENEREFLDPDSPLFPLDRSSDSDSSVDYEDILVFAIEDL